MYYALVVFGFRALCSLPTMHSGGGQAVVDMCRADVSIGCSHLFHVLDFLLYAVFVEVLRKYVA